LTVLGAPAFLAAVAGMTGVTAVLGAMVFLP
jgi:hypothetical protein